MKFIDEKMGMRDADSGDEAGVSVQQLEQDLAKAQQEIIELPAGFEPGQKANRSGDPGHGDRKIGCLRSWSATGLASAGKERC